MLKIILVIVTFSSFYSQDFYQLNHDSIYKALRASYDSQDINKINRVIPELKYYSKLAYNAQDVKYFGKYMHWLLSIYSYKQNLDVIQNTYLKYNFFIEKYISKSPDMLEIYAIYVNSFRMRNEFEKYIRLHDKYDYYLNKYYKK